MSIDREKVIAWLTEISLRPCDFTTDDFDAYETELLANEALEICEDAKVFNQQRNDALALLKEQEQIKEESITPFEVLEIISSSYGGKQIFFQEENGMIYDRYKCEYITLEDAVYRMAKMVGDNGDA